MKIDWLFVNRKAVVQFLRNFDVFWSNQVIFAAGEPLYGLETPY